MNNSKFTGSAWGLFGWNLLLVLSVYLFVIPVVFVWPKYVRWLYEHIEIDGQQLEFAYEEPWWELIGWTLFIMITFGLGAFYAEKKIQQFIISNVKVEGDESNAESSFDGSAWGIFGYSFLAGISVYLLMIPLVLVIVSMVRWYNDHTKISGRQLTFTYEGAWWGVIGWMLFSLVTLGIGSFYAQKKIYQWEYEHTHFVTN